jgi:hypothetical protein
MVEFIALAAAGMAGCGNRAMERRSKLASLPFIALYASSLSACILWLGHKRWGSTPWFPFATGMTAATALLAMKYLSSAFLLAQPGHRWRRIVFFWLCSIAPAIGIPFVITDDAMLAT